MTDPRRLEYVPIDDLTPAVRNPKHHDEAGIRASIVRHGFVDPALLDERTGRLIEGHGRVDALRARRDAGDTPPDGVTVDIDGVWRMPVVRGWSSTSDSEAEALLIGLNALPPRGGWDTPELAVMLQEIAATPFGLDGTGYSPVDLDGLLASLTPPAEEDFAEPEEGDRADPRIVRPGDLWLLGGHRLLCADATSPENIAAVLDGGVPRLSWLDPPYGISYQRVSGSVAIQNDGSELSAETTLLGFLQNAPLTEASFVCCDWRSEPMVLRCLTSTGRAPKACIVWDKGSRTQNLDRFAKRHEFIIYCGPYGGQPTRGTDVWLHPRDWQPDHPTPKPVGLIREAILAATDPGDLVLDGFAGLAPSILAAEATGRRAAAIEMDTGYVEGSCVRWQRATGVRPVRDGQTWDFLAPGGPRKVRRRAPQPAKT